MRFILAGLTLAIAASVGFFLFSSSRFVVPKGAAQNLRTIAEITAIEGDVRARLPRSLREEPVIGPRSLSALETLITGHESHATLTFPASETQLKILPGSRVVADFEAGDEKHIYLTILRGDIQTIAAGRTKGAKNATSAEVRIFKDGRPYSEATQTTSSVIQLRPLIKKQPALSATNPDTASTTEPVVMATQIDESDTPSPKKEIPRVLPPKSKSIPSRVDAMETLSNNEIATAIASQRARLQRCFVGFMERSKNQKAKGTIYIAFQIQKSGKSENVRLVRSAFKDKILNECVIEVVARTPFPSFRGKLIKIDEFPIRYE